MCELAIAMCSHMHAITMVSAYISKQGDLFIIAKLHSKTPFLNRPTHFKTAWPIISHHALYYASVLLELVVQPRK